MCTDYIEEAYLEIQLFLEGYKPALLMGEYSRSFRLKKDCLVGKYPYIYLEKNNTYLFFQSYDDLFWFEEYGIEYSEETGTPEWYDDSLLGEILGIPPKAIDYYISDTRILENRVNDVTVNYCGLIFISHRDDVEVNLYWLKSNLYVPKDYINYIEEVYDSCI